MAKVQIAKTKKGYRVTITDINGIDADLDKEMKALGSVSSLKELDAKIKTIFDNREVEKLETVNNMTLPEYTDKKFAGNVSAFCAWAKITRPTYYSIASGKTKPQLRLRELFRRKGIKLKN
jgi:hypothetical protein